MFYRNFGKRSIDILLSIVALVILFPLILTIIICLKIDSKGPIFFKQRRMGKDKDEFMIYKFRTMKVNTPNNIPTHLLQNPEIYITRLGLFLRKYSLDELPQMLNIIKGEMSIIGPRPALRIQEDLIAERDKYGANNITPGLTGWAQVNGRDEIPIDTKALFDGEYAKKIDFKLDIKILYLTFINVVSTKDVCEGAKPPIQNRVNKVENSW